MNSQNLQISYKKSIRDTLTEIGRLEAPKVLFIVDDYRKLIGSITDGDIRRAILRSNLDLDTSVDKIMNREPVYIIENNIDTEKIIKLRKQELNLIPLVNTNLNIIDYVNFKKVKSFLPIDAIIMAGGEGKRLRPLTEKTPKPLLRINNIPIVEHKIEYLKKYSISNINIVLGYLGNQIEDYLRDRYSDELKLRFFYENFPLGTLGGVSKIMNFFNDTVLISNGDLMTDLDYEKFYLEHKKSNSDLSILSIPFKFKIPYAIIKSKNGKVSDLIEKPTKEFLTNGGIYLVKRKLLKMIPKEKFYDATDFIENLLNQGFSIRTFKHNGYWSDIGSLDDYKKTKKLYE